MNDLESNLKSTIKSAVLKSFDVEINIEDIVIEIPKEKAHGDYSTNVAMRLVKQLKSNPRVVASTLIENIDNENANITKCEIAGPGFINFFMNSNSITDVIAKVLEKKELFGSSDFGKKVKVNLEYVSANPTGDLHPGHARGAAMGDSVSNVMSFAGYDVTREYYVNDAGNQINNMALSVQARYLQEFGVEAQIPENGYFGGDIIDIAKEIKEVYGDKFVNDNSAETIATFREIGLEKELLKLKNDLELFNVKFDVWTSETSIYTRGLVEKALAKLIEQNMTYELDGALWLRTTDFNDDKDRVLRKSDGSYTYLTPDIAYHLDKLDRGYDKLVNFFGADHHGYITRLKAAIQALGYESDKLSVDITQMARMLKDGEEFKLSKRSGKSVALKDLIEEAGVDAVRYFFASRAADTQMDFDIDMAKRQTSENPVYYAQYAHARMCSILSAGSDIEIANSYELITNAKEIDLCKHINEFTNVVIDAAKSRQAHKVCNYISKLAAYFHSFYGECKVIDRENIELSQQRLALVKATQTTLKNALKLIGVSAPERM